MGSLDWKGHFKPIAFAITSHEDQLAVGAVFHAVAQHTHKLNCAYRPSILVADSAGAFDQAYIKIGLIFGISFT